MKDTCAFGSDHNEAANRYFCHRGECLLISPDRRFDLMTVMPERVADASLLSQIGMVMEILTYWSIV